MKMHINLKGILGFLALKLPKYLIYIKLIHTNSLPQCKYNEDHLRGLGENFMNFTCRLVKCLKKLKAKGLLKPLDPKLLPNPLPAKFDVSKRCAYHQGPGHDTDRCYDLRHAIQDLIDTKVIAPLTRPNITKNPLPNYNFGRGPRINCLISKEEGEKDPSELIYDIPEYFMMTWEELMGMTSTTGYDI